jgi:hypothetical protein
MSNRDREQEVNQQAENGLHPSTTEAQSNNNLDHDVMLLKSKVEELITENKEYSTMVPSLPSFFVYYYCLFFFFFFLLLFFSC